VSEGLFGGGKGHSSPDGHLGDREKLSWTGNDGDGSFQRKKKKRKGLSKGANLHRPGRRGRIRKTGSAAQGMQSSGMGSTVQEEIIFLGGGRGWVSHKPRCLRILRTTV